MTRTSRRGFTMVETTLVMAFVATLLITVALVITQLTSIYQKGLALRAVNSTGRELIDEFTRGITAAPTKGVNYLCNTWFRSSADAQTACANNNAELLSYHEDYANINGANVPIRGVFCTGRYSYIWNTGYALNNSNTAYRAELIVNDTNYGDSFHLMRVNDSNRALCGAYLSSNSYNYSQSSGKATYNITSDSEPLELLTGSEDNLVIYDFVAFPSTLHDITQHTFYSLTFTLGTLQGGVNIMSAGDFCTEGASEGLDTDFAYCAVNKFNFSVRATGELTAEERSERGYY